MADTPELDKMMEVRETSQAIGEFLDWLYNSGYRIAQWHDHWDNGLDFDDVEYEEQPAGWYPVPRRIEEWLAEYFEIDLDKVEKERRAILDEFRTLSDG